MSEPLGPPPSGWHPPPAGPQPGWPYPGTGRPPSGVPADHHPGSRGGGPPRRYVDRVVIALVVALALAAAAIAVILLVNRAPDPKTPIAQGSSNTPIAIPDNTTIGVTDTITLRGDDTVGRLDVVVELEHTFPSELTAVLVSPAGREAVVYARAAQTGPRVRLTLSSGDAASPLRNLVGEPVAGAWRLTLRDGIAADTGTLLRWEVTAYPAADDAPSPAPERAMGRSTPGLAIPDPDPDGAVTDVTDRIALSGYGTAERIIVTVSITHGYSRDLYVELQSPTGISVVLSQSVGGLEPNITLTLDSSVPGSPLNALVGEPLAGPWQLTVRDQIAADVGTLDSWEITVTS